MTDWIYLWTGVTEQEHMRRWDAERRAQAARTRAYLSRYWRECVDVEFEREFACFWPERKAAA